LGHDEFIEARPEVSVLIVGYRTRGELAACLPSLFASSQGVTMETVLVDNASGDGTAEWVTEAFPRVRLVALDENIGFARAVNLAADLARGEYVLLLNPDTVVRPGAVDALLRFARAHPQAGLVGGRTLTEAGATEPSSCWGRPTLWSTFCFATGLSTAFRRSSVFNPERMPNWNRDDSREVGVITGCLLLASIHTWRALGGFDPRFFMYSEDTDLSIRAWKAGYRPAITPEAEVIHTIGASSSVKATRQVMIMRGKVTMARKHWAGGLGILMVGMLAAGVGLRAGLDAARRRVRRVRHRGEPSEWAGAWAQRAEWLGGYPPTVAAVPSTAELVNRVVSGGQP
jgi:N-acetylglucosaminyl-diphospho-decaprenol L-rhamnosyltransferase